MDVRKHEVTGQRRVDRDVGGLLVANLADHDHVGILPQEGAQRAGEGQPDLRLDVDLVDAADLVLDRIFRREDVEVRLVDRG